MPPFCGANCHLKIIVTWTLGLGVIVTKCSCHVDVILMTCYWYFSAPNVDVSQETDQWEGRWVESGNVSETVS